MTSPTTPHSDTLEECIPSDLLLMSNPPLHKCKICGQSWFVGSSPPTHRKLVSDTMAEEVNIQMKKIQHQQMEGTLPFIDYSKPIGKRSINAGAFFRWLEQELTQARQEGIAEGRKLEKQERWDKARDMIGFEMDDDRTDLEELREYIELEYGDMVEIWAFPKKSLAATESEEL